MGPIGVPELSILLVMGIFWLVPVVAGVWALVTLSRIRAGQDEVLRRLAAIEQRGAGVNPV